MKRIFLLTALFCSLLTAGAQTDNVRRSKPQTPAKAQTAPARKPAPAKTSKPAGPALSNPSGSYGGHDYVDLGLPSGTLWATCNVGATKPTENGDYFAWGETKKFYDWDTYFDTSDGGKTFRKYNNNGGKAELDRSDDVAYVNWGSGWRMPSEAQLTELREKCIWTWYSKNGVCGYVVESKYNDCSLFLPAAGFRSEGSLYNAGSDGYYWSRSLSTSYSYRAYGLYFYSGGIDWSNSGRFIGFPVRPVRVSASE